MFDIQLRSLKDRLADPLVHSIPNAIHPNHLTLLAFACGIGGCISAARSSPDKQDGALSLSLVLWALNRLLDCLDGSLARERGIASESGGFLDLLSDFVVYAMIPIAVGSSRTGADGGAIQRDGWDLSGSTWMAIAVLEATFWINNFILFYAAAVSSAKQDAELTSVTMRPAIVEGFESGILFTAMLAFPSWITELAWLMAVLVAIGCLQRAFWLLSVLARLDREKVASSSAAKHQ